jgi:hypothetical protein
MKEVAHTAPLVAGGAAAGGGAAAAAAARCGLGSTGVELPLMAPIIAGVGITCRFLFAFSLKKFLAIFAEVKVNFGIKVLKNQLGCSVESSVEKLG